MTEIRDGINRRTCLNVFSFDGFLANHDPAGRRVESEAITDGSLLLDRSDLFRFEIPQKQLVTSRLNHRLRSFAQQRVRRILQLVGGADRLQQLFLGRQQVRTIDLHQMIPLVYPNAGIVDEQTVQPAGEPCGDVREIRLVVVDFANHPHLDRGHGADDRSGAHTGNGNGTRR